ncbi:MAG: DUF4347 domain-containing protein, partial [Pseudomonadota bacterium]
MARARSLRDFFARRLAPPSRAPDEPWQFEALEPRLLLSADAALLAADVEQLTVAQLDAAGLDPTFAERLQAHLPEAPAAIGIVPPVEPAITFNEPASAPGDELVTDSPAVPAAEVGVDRPAEVPTAGEGSAEPPTIHSAVPVEWFDLDAARASLASDAPAANAPVPAGERESDVPLPEADVDWLAPLPVLAAPIAEAPAPAPTLVFVDGGIDDYESLLEAIEARVAQASTVDAEVVVTVLDPDVDGVAQISSVLARYDAVGAMHIFSHGAVGQLRLGSTTLNANELDRHRSALNGWAHALQPGADLYLYGCELAGDQAGERLVQLLAEATGTDVAASEDLTGHAALGGDWDLEYQVGDVARSTFAGGDAFASFKGVLDGAGELDLDSDEVREGLLAALEPLLAVFDLFAELPVDLPVGEEQLRDLFEPLQSVLDLQDAAEDLFRLVDAFTFDLNDLDAEIGRLIGLGAFQPEAPEHIARLVDTLNGEFDLGLTTEGFDYTEYRPYIASLVAGNLFSFTALADPIGDLLSNADDTRGDDLPFDPGSVADNEALADLINERFPDTITETVGANFDFSPYRNEVWQLLGNALTFDPAESLASIGSLIGLGSGEQIDLTSLAQIADLAAELGLDVASEAEAYAALVFSLENSLDLLGDALRLGVFDVSGDIPALRSALEDALGESFADLSEETFDTFRGELLEYLNGDLTELLGRQENIDALSSIVGFLRSDAGQLASIEAALAELDLYVGEGLTADTLGEFIPSLAQALGLELLLGVDDYPAVADIISFAGDFDPTDEDARDALESFVLDRFPEVFVTGLGADNVVDYAWSIFELIRGDAGDQLLAVGEAIGLGEGVPFDFSVEEHREALASALALDPGAITSTNVGEFLGQALGLVGIDYDFQSELAQVYDTRSLGDMARLARTLESSDGRVDGVELLSISAASTHLYGELLFAYLQADQIALALGLGSFDPQSPTDLAALQVELSARYGPEVISQLDADNVPGAFEWQLFQIYQPDWLSNSLIELGETLGLQVDPTFDVDEPATLQALQSELENAFGFDIFPDGAVLSAESLLEYLPFIDGLLQGADADGNFNPWTTEGREIEVGALYATIRDALYTAPDGGGEFTVSMRVLQLLLEDVVFPEYSGDNPAPQTSPLDVSLVAENVASYAWAVFDFNHPDFLADNAQAIADALGITDAGGFDPDNVDHLDLLAAALGEQFPDLQFTDGSLSPSNIQLVLVQINDWLNDETTSLEDLLFDAIGDTRYTSLLAAAEVFDLENDQDRRDLQLYIEASYGIRIDGGLRIEPDAQNRPANFEDFTWTILNRLEPTYIADNTDAITASYTLTGSRSFDAASAQDVDALESALQADGRLLGEDLTPDNLVQFLPEVFRWLNQPLAGEEAVEPSIDVDITDLDELLAVQTQINEVEAEAGVALTDFVGTLSATNLPLYAWHITGLLQPNFITQNADAIAELAGIDFTFDLNNQAHLDAAGALVGIEAGVLSTANLSEFFAEFSLLLGDSFDLANGAALLGDALGLGAAYDPDAQADVTALINELNRVFDLGLDPNTLPENFDANLYLPQVGEIAGAVDLPAVDGAVIDFVSNANLGAALDLIADFDTAALSNWDQLAGALNLRFAGDADFDALVAQVTGDALAELTGADLQGDIDTYGPFLSYIARIAVDELSITGFVDQIGSALGVIFDVRMITDVLASLTGEDPDADLATLIAAAQGVLADGASVDLLLQYLADVYLPSLSASADFDGVAVTAAYNADTQALNLGLEVNLATELVTDVSEGDVQSLLNELLQPLRSNEVFASIPGLGDVDFADVGSLSIDEVVLGGEVALAVDVAVDLSEALDGDDATAVGVDDVTVDVAELTPTVSLDLDGIDFELRFSEADRVTILGGDASFRASVPLTDAPTLNFASTGQSITETVDQWIDELQFDLVAAFDATLPLGATVGGDLDLGATFGSPILSLSSEDALDLSALEVLIDLDIGALEANLQSLFAPLADLNFDGLDFPFEIPQTGLGAILADLGNLLDFSGSITDFYDLIAAFTFEVTDFEADLAALLGVIDPLGDDLAALAAALEDLFDVDIDLPSFDPDEYLAEIASYLSLNGIDLSSLGLEADFDIRDYYEALQALLGLAELPVNLDGIRVELGDALGSLPTLSGLLRYITNTQLTTFSGELDLGPLSLAGGFFVEDGVKALRIDLLIEADGQASDSFSEADLVTALVGDADDPNDSGLLGDVGGAQAVLDLIGAEAGDLGVSLSGSTDVTVEGNVLVDLSAVIDLTDLIDASEALTDDDLYLDLRALEVDGRLRADAVDFSINFAGDVSVGVADGLLDVTAGLALASVINEAFDENEDGLISLGELGEGFGNLAGLSLAGSGALTGALNAALPLSVSTENFDASELGSPILFVDDVNVFDEIDPSVSVDIDLTALQDTLLEMLASLAELVPDVDLLPFDLPDIGLAELFAGVAELFDLEAPTLAFLDLFALEVPDFGTVDLFGFDISLFGLELGELLNLGVDFDFNLPGDWEALRERLAALFPHLDLDGITLSLGNWTDYFAEIYTLLNFEALSLALDLPALDLGEFDVDLGEFVVGDIGDFLARLAFHFNTDFGLDLDLQAPDLSGLFAELLSLQLPDFDIREYLEAFAGLLELPDVPLSFDAIRAEIEALLYRVPTLGGLIDFLGEFHFATVFSDLELGPFTLGGGYFADVEELRLDVAFDATGELSSLVTLTDLADALTSVLGELGSDADVAALLGDGFDSLDLELTGSSFVTAVAGLAAEASVGVSLTDLLDGDDQTQAGSDDVFLEVDAFDANASLRLSDLLTEINFADSVRLGVEGGEVLLLAGIALEADLGRYTLADGSIADYLAGPPPEDLGEDEVVWRTLASAEATLPLQLEINGADFSSLGSPVLLISNPDVFADPSQLSVTVDLDLTELRMTLLDILEPLASAAVDFADLPFDLPDVGLDEFFAEIGNLLDFATPAIEFFDLFAVDGFDFGALGFDITGFGVELQDLLDLDSPFDFNLDADWDALAAYLEDLFPSLDGLNLSLGNWQSVIAELFVLLRFEAIALNIGIDLPDGFDIDLEIGPLLGRLAAVLAADFGVDIDLEVPDFTGLLPELVSLGLDGFDIRDYLPAFAALLDLPEVPLSFDAIRVDVDNLFRDLPTLGQLIDYLVEVKLGNLTGSLALGPFTLSGGYFADLEEIRLDLEVDAEGSAATTVSLADFEEALVGEDGVLSGIDAVTAITDLIGNTADGLGVGLAGSTQVTVTGAVAAAASAGIRLADALDGNGFSSDDAFLTVDRFEADGEVELSDLEFSLAFGPDGDVIDVGIVNGLIDIVAGLTLDEPLSFVIGDSLGDLAFSLTGESFAVLPISADIGGVDIDQFGRPVLLIENPELFPTIFDVEDELAGLAALIGEVDFDVDDQADWDALAQLLNDRFDSAIVDGDLNLDSWRARAEEILVLLQFDALQDALGLEGLDLQVEADFDVFLATLLVRLTTDYSAFITPDGDTGEVDLSGAFDNLTDLLGLDLYAAFPIDASVDLDVSLLVDTILDIVEPLADLRPNLDDLDFTLPGGITLDDIFGGLTDLFDLEGVINRFVDLFALELGAFGPFGFSIEGFVTQLADLLELGVDFDVDLQADWDALAARLSELFPALDLPSDFLSLGNWTDYLAEIYIVLNFDALLAQLDLRFPDVDLSGLTLDADFGVFLDYLLFTLNTDFDLSLDLELPDFDGLLPELFSITIDGFDIRDYLDDFQVLLGLPEVPVSFDAIRLDIADVLLNFPSLSQLVDWIIDTQLGSFDGGVDLGPFRFIAGYDAGAQSLFFDVIFDADFGVTFEDISLESLASDLEAWLEPILGDAQLQELIGFAGDGVGFDAEFTGDVGIDAGLIFDVGLAADVSDFSNFGLDDIALSLNEVAGAVELAVTELVVEVSLGGVGIAIGNLDEETFGEITLTGTLGLTNAPAQVDLQTLTDDGGFGAFIDSLDFDATISIDVSLPLFLSLDPDNPIPEELAAALNSFQPVIIYQNLDFDPTDPGVGGEFILGVNLDFGALLSIGVDAAAGGLFESDLLTSDIPLLGQSLTDLFGLHVQLTDVQAQIVAALATIPAVTVRFVKDGENYRVEFQDGDLDELNDALTDGVLGDWFGETPLRFVQVDTDDDDVLDAGIVVVDLDLQLDLLDLELPLDFDLAALGELPTPFEEFADFLDSFLAVGVGGTLTLGADISLDGTIGLDLSDLAGVGPRVLLSDDFGAGVNLGATGEGLEFTAALETPLGEFGLFVRDGSATIESVNAGEPAFGVLVDTAGATAALSEVDVDGEDGDAVADLYVVEDVGFTLVTPNLIFTAALPLYFPTEALPVGGYTDDFQVDNVLTFTGALDTSVTDGISLSVAEFDAPDLAASISIIGLVNDPTFIVDSIDGLFEGLQDLLGSGLAVDVPVVGDGFEAASGFIGDLRDAVLAPLQDALADAGNPSTIELLQQVLFDSLGQLVTLRTEFSVPAFAAELGAFIGLAEGESFDVLNDDHWSALDALVDDADVSRDTAGEIDVLEAIATALDDFLTDQVLDPFVVDDEDLDGDIQRLLVNVNAASQIGVLVTDREIQLNLSLADVIATFEIPLDFQAAIPGFAFEVDGGIEVVMDYLLDLGIGFYADPVVVSADGVEFGDSYLYLDILGDEAQFNVSASLPDDFSASAVIGILEATLEEIVDTDGASRIEGTIALDISDQDPLVADNFEDGRLIILSLTGDQVSEIGLATARVIRAELDLLADADFSAAIGFGGGSQFPEIEAEIRYFQEFSGSFTVGVGFRAEPSSPSILISNAALDLGTFISEFMAPVLEVIQDITDPIAPLIELANTPLPVLSDLSGEDVTFLDIVAVGEDGARFAAFVEQIAFVIELIDSIPTNTDTVMIPLPNVVFGNTGIDLGEVFGEEFDGLEFVDLSADLVGDDADTDGIDMDAFSGADSFDSRLDQSGAGMATSNFSRTLTTGSGSLEIPLLTDPGTVFQLILGNFDYLASNPVDLFIYNLPSFELGAEFGASFPIFPGLNAFLGGGVAIGIDFAFGFDTTGIIEFLETDDVADIFNGFFIVDDPTPGDGDDPDEAYITAGIEAGASLGIGGLVEVGVVGGVEATIGFDLADPNDDGRMRIDEIGERFLLGPQCIFDIGGTVDVGLAAFLWVGIDVPLIGEVTIFSDEFELFSATIADFSIECPPVEPPVLVDQSNVEQVILANGETGARLMDDPVAPDAAGALATGGTLTLNMGDRAGDRRNVNTDGGDERFEITQVESEDGIVTRVKYLGFEEEYLNVGTIVVNAGDGDDDIVVKALEGSGLTVVANGGEGNDYITVSGGATLIADGGAGNDTIIASSGDDQLDGGSGNDYIQAADGNDFIRGGAGSDTIHGDAGDDIIYGDDEAAVDAADTGTVAREAGDVIFGWDGDDEIYGSRFDDTLAGGAGDDLVFGAAGDDAISWYDDAYEWPEGFIGVRGQGGGDDVIEGGEGDDRLILLGANDGVGQSIDAMVDNALRAGSVGIDWGDRGEITFDDIELLDLTASTGGDTITFGDLRASDLMQVDVGMGGERRFEERTVTDENGESFVTIVPVGDNDGAADTLVLQGGANDRDFFEVFTENEFWQIDRYDRDLVPDGEPENADAALITSFTLNQSSATEDGDRLVIQAFDSVSDDDLVDDFLDGRGVTNQLALLTLEAGAGNDTVFGSRYGDTLSAGAGDDVISGGRGVDSFQDGGGTDTLFETVGQDGEPIDFFISDQSLIIGLYDDARAGTTQTFEDQWGNTVTTSAAFDGEAEIESLLDENGQAVFEIVTLTGVGTDAFRSANTFVVQDFTGEELILDGFEGSDTYLIGLSAPEVSVRSGEFYDTLFTVDDTGLAGNDTLVVSGSPGDDLFHFLTEGNDGLVRRLDGDGLFEAFASFNVDELVDDLLDQSETPQEDDGVRDTGSLLPGRVFDDEVNTQTISYITSDGNIIADISFRGGDGDDVFVFDDTARSLEVYGDEGDDSFFVGNVLEQVIETQDDGSLLPVVTAITDGVGFGARLFGGAGDDYFEVNRNVAELWLYGEDGDDIFFLKAHLTYTPFDETSSEDVDALEAALLDAGLIDANTDVTVGNVEEFFLLAQQLLIDNDVAFEDDPQDYDDIAEALGNFLRQSTRESVEGQDQVNLTSRAGENDQVSYVRNAPVYIFGGEGFDSVVIAGTAIADEFYVFTEIDPATSELVQRIYGAGLVVEEIVGVEQLVLITGGGDDVVFVYGSLPGQNIIINTGSGDDTVEVGGDLGFGTFIIPERGSDVIADQATTVVDSVEFTYTRWNAYDFFQRGFFSLFYDVPQRVSAESGSRTVEVWGSDISVTRTSETDIVTGEAFEDLVDQFILDLIDDLQANDTNPDDDDLVVDGEFVNWWWHTSIPQSGLELPQLSFTEQFDFPDEPVDSEDINSSAQSLGLFSAVVLTIVDDGSGVDEDGNPVPIDAGGLTETVEFSLTEFETFIASEWEDPSTGDPFSDEIGRNADLGVSDTVGVYDGFFPYTFVSDWIFGFWLFGFGELRADISDFERLESIDLEAGDSSSIRTVIGTVTVAEETDTFVAPETRALDSFSGNLELVGAIGDDTLIINNQFGSDFPNGTLIEYRDEDTPAEDDPDGVQLTGFGIDGAAQVVFEGFNTINFNFSDASDVLTIDYTEPGTTLVLNLAGGDDSVQVNANAADLTIVGDADGLVTRRIWDDLNGDGVVQEDTEITIVREEDQSENPDPQGSDRVTVGNGDGSLEDILGPVVFLGDGGSDEAGTDTLVLRGDGRTDSLAPTIDLLTFSIDGVSFDGGSIDGLDGSTDDDVLIAYDDLETLRVDLGSGADDVLVAGVEAVLQLNTGAGDDQIIVSSDRELRAGNLSAIAFDVTIDAGTGTNTLIVDDSSDSTGDVVTIDEDEISGASVGLITYLADQNAGSYAGGLAFYAGTGSDEISVTGLRAQDLTRIFANDGNDLVVVEASVSQGILEVFGEGGADTLDAQASSLGVALIGGRGDDTIIGSSGTDLLVGGAALIVRDGSFRLTRVDAEVLEDGDDRVEGRDGADVLVGGTGADELFGEVGADTLVGDLASILWSAIDQTVIEVDSRGGDDTAGAGDTLSGGIGGDLLLGGIGEDSLSGDDGADVLVGDHALYLAEAAVLVRLTSVSTGTGARDELIGGVGKDILVGGAGGDQLEGDEGADVLFGDSAAIVGDDGSAAANDLIAIDAAIGGNDVLTGGGGADFLVGGAGADDLTGGGGDDLLLGDAGSIERAQDGTVQRIFTTDAAIGGDDTLAGDEGRDVLLGGAGADELSGDAG